jgi:hypothetical protein
MAMVNDDGISSVDCEYTGDCWFAKNCYMTFSAWKIENVMYSNFILGGKDIVDSLMTLDSADWIYECIGCEKCYKVKNSQLCISCTDSSFLYDCRNSMDCFMSAGLRNKRYCYKNEQYTKEAYEEILQRYKLDTFSGVEKAQKEFDEFILGIPRRYSQIFQSLNCTGDIMTNAKKCQNCFIANNSENSKYIQMGGKNVDSYDLMITGEQSECYEGIVVDHSNHNFFGLFSVKSQDITYTMHCHSSKYLFGCVGLKKGEYSIFNKRYTKDEYEKLISKIRQQMMDMPYIDALGNEYRYGEYFPIELSYFGYNETPTTQAFPLSKSEVLGKGYNWQDTVQKTTGKQTVETQDIPDSISDISESFTDEILECMDCKRNYKIVGEELRFYKTMNIPIPRYCFYCRHEKRLNRRNPFKLWSRTCMCDKMGHIHGTEKCSVKSYSSEFETSYSPDRPEIVYCEKCYQQEVL